MASRGAAARYRLVVLVVACCGLASAGCFPLPDMDQSPANAPRDVLLPPPGALAVGAPRIMDRREALRGLSNPLPATPEVLAEGAELYRIYCEMCHGTDGAGQGVVAEHFRRVPDLKTGYIQNYPDGRLYTVLREGGFNMPRYGDALSVAERWAVVHYVRSFGDTP